MDLTEDEIMRELEKDIDKPDMFTIGFLDSIDTKGEKTDSDMPYTIDINNKSYLCIGDFRIELDNRTSAQKSKSRYYFKKKSNGI
tara:strand:- start:336 stop:590 length:255 start_codon:yes stop_codon:yes gene_type:complete